MTEATKTEAVTQNERAAYTEQIKTTFTSGIMAIFETGKLLVSAKENLKHGEFLDMIRNDLPFGPRTAQTIMSICADPRLTNAQHIALLPPAWGTLAELSKLHEDEFDKGIADGSIRPDMTRAEAKKLRATPGHKAAEEDTEEQQVLAESLFLRGIELNPHNSELALDMTFKPEESGPERMATLLIKQHATPVQVAKALRDAASRLEKRLAE